MATMPRRREEELEIVELPEETLVYDLTRHKAYCLNRTAALVWKGCDGQTTTGEMAYVLQAETGMRGDDEVIAYALGQLERARLLAEPAPVLPSAGLARRDFLLRLAMVGAGVALLPAVASLLAPTPAQASHSPGLNANCTNVNNNCRHCANNANKACCAGSCVSKSQANTNCGCGL